MVALTFKSKAAWAVLAVAAAVIVWTLLYEPQVRSEEDAFQASVLGNVLQGDPDNRFKAVSEVREFVFPQDHGPHAEFQTEWWYFTGYLADADGADYGYQFTVFRRAVAWGNPRLDSNWATNQVYLAHVGITDVQSGEYLVDEMYSRGALGLAGAQAQPFSVHVEDWSVIGSQSECRGCLDLDIRVDSDNFSFDLQLVSAKGAVYHGNKGVSRKGDSTDSASYYYSLTRLQTAGTVTIYGKPREVAGTSWMDHEWFSSALDESQSGWDWFSLHLDDGRELMFFQVRNHDQSKRSYKYGIVIDENGDVVQLNPQEITFRVTGTWTSPATQSSYPVNWIIEVPQHHLRLQIEATVDAQERNESFRYWEGLVRISATQRTKTVSGYGYLEMTGYER